MQKKRIKIGVVGFSRNSFDTKMARQILEGLFNTLHKKHSNKEVEIVSGYTNSGVPQIAYELADKFGFTTVGFSAEQALTVRSGVYAVKKVILKGKKFGDESEDFVRYIDGLIRVGGGPQSRKEVALFSEINTGYSLKSKLQEYEVEWFGTPPKDEKVNDKIQGLKIVKEFLSQELHDDLWAKIDNGEWSNELKRRVQHYGYKYDYRARRIDASMQVLDLPVWVKPVVDQIIDLKLMSVHPDQMIINEYIPGQGISNHIDCEPCFEEEIVSISLGSTAMMDFTNVLTKQRTSIILNPRSAISLKGESRYSWMHGIVGRKSDVIKGLRMPRSRRISLTFRKVILHKD